uniref:GPO family capsid scaffolding protein n=1 Tax=Cellvibrio fontiphilus TaxID=1815559 RepID=UPI002B4BA635|nr:GPO family capsid scaffolding protein [Cellvibrio fontiphilus]
MKKSKKFRVAREGATTDGRKISREWITQMAANYDPKVFGARVNLEHLKGLLPDGPFRAYVDVLSLSTEEDNGKLHLVAEISPTDDLVAMNKKRQKVYTSIEVNPSFADTGEAYLVGIAVTDDPASLGTEMLEFSANAKVNPLAARKSDPDNLFTAAEETTLEFTEVDDDTKKTLLDAVKGFFNKHKKFADAEFETFRKDLESTLELLVLNFTKSTANSVIEYQTLKDSHEQLQAEFKALQQKLDSTPGRQNHRSTATGNNGNHPETDC